MVINRFQKHYIKMSPRLYTRKQVERFAAELEGEERVTFGIVKSSLGYINEREVFEDNIEEALRAADLFHLMDRFRQRFLEQVEA